MTAESWGLFAAAFVVVFGVAFEVILEVMVFEVSLNMATLLVVFGGEAGLEWLIGLSRILTQHVVGADCHCIASIQSSMLNTAFG